MARRQRTSDNMLGNRSLTSFDFCIIGSGAGGATAAHVLTAAGRKVLILETGHNAFPGLDDPGDLQLPLHSNDELKEIRDYLEPGGFLEPRTFRQGAGIPGSLADDVNSLPKTVGGAFVHADCKTPRFNAVDFRLVDAMRQVLSANPGLAVPGFTKDGADLASANFANWPFTYDELEPFYVEAEQLYGVQGKQGDNVFESPRSRTYPMPPGVPMYLGLLLADGARQVTLGDQGPLHPHTYPAAITSRPYGDAPTVRPPCVDCGLCSGFGCPNNAKGSPAVTALRRALLTQSCLLIYNATATRLVNDGTHVSAVEYIDGDDMRQMATAHGFILAASPIEDARLCLLSPGPDGTPLGNRSSSVGGHTGQVGRNLMFHFQSNVNGFLPRRVHGQRGRAVTHGISDFRGVVPGGDAIRVVTDGSGAHVAMGGICEFGASQGLPISDDGSAYAQLDVRSGTMLKNAMRDQALGQHLFGLTMQAEDAPQLRNFVDLDPRYKDVYGQPVARITYNNHAYEKMARTFYVPYMRQVVLNAGANPDRIFLTPISPAFVGPPSSRHIMGTLRMGTDPTTSVIDPSGRFNDVDNLYACDGSVFPTSAGYNPTLTIIAGALRIAHALAGTPPVIS